MPNIPSLMEINLVYELRASYYLQLAYGHGWCILAAESCEVLIDDMAHIMRLNSSESIEHSRLIFISNRDSHDSPELHKFKHIDGWKTYDLNSIRIWFHNEINDVICEIGDEEGHHLNIMRMLYSLYPVYLRELKHGGFPIHAALIERDGQGFLLAAPSDTGKSTCCSRIPGPWRVLCDDLSLIVYDKNKEYIAHPFPTWSEYLWGNSNKTWDVQEAVPLNGIFFLERSDHDEALPFGQEQATAYINDSVRQIFELIYHNMPQEDQMELKRDIFHNSCDLSRAVPSFILRFTLSGNFWEEMEKSIDSGIKNS